MNNYLACIAVIVSGEKEKEPKKGQRGEGKESVHLCAN